MKDSRRQLTRLEQICVKAIQVQEDESETHNRSDLEHQNRDPPHNLDTQVSNTAEVVLRIECITEHQMKVMNRTFLRGICLQAGYHGWQFISANLYKWLMFTSNVYQKFRQVEARVLGVCLKFTIRA